MMNTSRFKILHIEDTDDYINLTKAILGDHFDITEARTFNEGIERLKSYEHYDLAIVNMNLTQYSDKKGAEILLYIRNHLPSLPRIAFTGAKFDDDIFSEYLLKYGVKSLLRKEEFRVELLRNVVRKALGANKYLVNVQQKHHDISKYIIHLYQNEKLKDYQKLQLFEVLIDNPFDEEKDAIILFEKQEPYVQKTSHNRILQPGRNRVNISPVFTNYVGDTRQVGINIKIFIEGRCLWESKETFLFHIVEQMPIVLKQAACGDSWMHFLIMSCITPNSQGIIKLANEVRKAWGEKNPSITWKASNYTEFDAVNIIECLRNVLQYRVIREDVHLVNIPEDENIIYHDMRLPDEILESGGANCLYYSLLYASVIEQLNIQPLLLFMPGHVVPGWKRSRFSDPLIFHPDNFSLLEEYCVFIESTRTSSKDVNFEEILISGKRSFQTAKDLCRKNKPVYLLDVSQLRRNGFYPYGN